MISPGVWVLGEVRKHVQTAGMGIVVEYAGATGQPQWQQPKDLVWDYAKFAETVAERESGQWRTENCARVRLEVRRPWSGRAMDDQWKELSEDR